MVLFVITIVRFSLINTHNLFNHPTISSFASFLHKPLPFSKFVNRYNYNYFNLFLQSKLSETTWFHHFVPMVVVTMVFLQTRTFVQSVTMFISKKTLFLSHRLLVLQRTLVSMIFVMLWQLFLSLTVIT